MLSLHTILYPTDLSEDSCAALDLACSFARDHGARLVVLGVYPSPLNGAEAIDRERDDSLKTDLLAQLHGLNIDPSISAEYVVEEGRPAVLILSVAEELKADLIVMGTHGRTRIRRLLMGSVAEAVSRSALCPVLTVRSGLAGDHSGTAATDAADPSREVVVTLGTTHIRGTLQWSGTPRGVVIFAHGSGSSRFSPRNRFVAETLVDAGFATLLMDLLTDAEAANRDNVFDIDLLAERVAGSAEWIARQPQTAGLPVGYFGASTGSAAALIAAARHPERVAAVVSRGGRPDLAKDLLPEVHAPTLLIVGGDDEPVLTWNRDSLKLLTCTKDIAVIPGATHLFEEAGTLENVAELARNWFVLHLQSQ